MRQIRSIVAYSIVFFGILLTACEKEPVIGPGNGNGNPGNPNPGPVNPVSAYFINVKAEIKVGEIIYDSIPTTLQVTSWDSSDVMHQFQINLTAGMQSIELPKAHKTYLLKISKWGVVDEKRFTRIEVPAGSLVKLGGSRAAKKLKLEEGFIFASGAYQPESKSIYSYNSDGSVRQIEYYQKRPQFPDLKLYHTDVFVYVGGKVDRINRLDQNGSEVGYTEFTYGGDGKVTNILQDSYGNITGAAYSYGVDTEFSTIDVDYLFGNGQTMSYTQKFKSGNKMQESAMSSTGAGETGKYYYDYYINPFAHNDLPNLYMSNLSKNNRISEEKTYSGGFPVAIPYQIDYSYDGDGFPTNVVKAFKSAINDDHLYKTKTVYTY